MKYSFAAASAILAASAVAQPHGHQHQAHHDKRGIVTEVEWVTQTQYVTQTVGDDSQPTAQSSAVQSVQQQEYKAPVSSSSSSSVYVAPTTLVQQTKPSSTYVAPVSTYVAPTSTYVAPTSTYVAPSSTYVAPAASSSAASGSSSSGSGGLTGSYTGDITYYPLGQTACGDLYAGQDNSIDVVAISHILIPGEVTHSTDPFCSKTITITANGKTAKANVRDKCAGCAEGDIDVSEKLFVYFFGSTGSGRVHDIKWSFD